MIQSRTLARPSAAADSSLLEKPPPHSAEMEKGVLSSMMIGGRATIAECAEKISADHFFVPAHRTIYNVLVEMWGANQQIDLLTVTEELRKRNLLEVVGGAAAVTEVQTFVPSEANVGY